MQIIDRVDINYFRSIYSISLNNCRHVNIVTGSNDSGKSNLLKALNLFFNNEVETHSEFEFLRDLNRDREEEARAAKGRMTIWIKVFFNNFLHWRSLPDQFSVKRTWNRYDSAPVDTYSEDIPATTMGRFLNKIRYHYIPAVRSRDIFSDLLADLHDTLVQDESRGLRNSSDALVADLHQLTESMSAEILDRLKIDSTISIPESLQDLFRALDFSTKFGKYEVPLVMRGDGIQSRHLPFILNYISSKSSQHHIWGYEEPENSLELSRAFEMADDFKSTFSKENQIFLTTHSPAFYDISGSRSAKWYIENRLEDDRVSSQVQVITNTSLIDKTMGLLSVITPRMKEVYNEFESLKESVGDMQQRVNNAECPVVYVEGPTDVSILECAKEKLGFDNLNVKFESANGAGDVTEFLKVSVRVKRDNRPLLGIYDADARGRREFAKFQNYHKLAGTNFRTLERNRRIYAGSLEIPAHLSDAEAAYKAVSMPLPLPIEFMFDEDLVLEAISEGKLELVSRKGRIANDELPLEVTIDAILKDKIDERFLYLSKSVSDNCKTPFANWVTQKPAEKFEPFRSLLDQIAAAVGA
ncbi:AAA family ATPase [Sphingomonas sp.]|uniref:ATP-dependent nuclease n=1 Tax=Sphingomonas sp. TaxID=28214 RepID=UPI00307D73CD